ncbi:MAG: hypothetical protein ACRYFS_09520 [Janthinobacterium lividum]
MAVLDKQIVPSKTETLFISAEQLDDIRAIVARQFEELGIEYDPTATAADSRRAMLEAGFRPEANEISRGIVAAREE